MRWYHPPLLIFEGGQITLCDVELFMAFSAFIKSGVARTCAFSEIY